MQNYVSSFTDDFLDIFLHIWHHLYFYLFPVPIIIFLNGWRHTELEKFFNFSRFFLIGKTLEPSMKEINHWRKMPIREGTKMGVKVLLCKADIYCDDWKVMPGCIFSLSFNSDRPNRFKDQANYRKSFLSNFFS